MTIAVTWCFHLQNRKMHLWMTALISSLLRLMICLLSAMDHPYIGQMSVTAQPFQLIYDDLMKPGGMLPAVVLRQRHKPAKRTMSIIAISSNPLLSGAGAPLFGGRQCAAL